MKKASIFAFAVLVPLALVAAIVVVLAKPGNLRTSTPNWQYSATPSVELGVRDKFGDLKAYTATFVVTTPSRHKESAVRSVKNAGWGFARYPNDFGPDADTVAGAYSWSCTVGGKTVTHGSFNYASTSHGIQLTVNDN